MAYYENLIALVDVEVRASEVLQCVDKSVVGVVAVAGDVIEARD